MMRNIMNSFLKMEVLLTFNFLLPRHDDNEIHIPMHCNVWGERASAEVHLSWIVQLPDRIKLHDGPAQASTHIWNTFQYIRRMIFVNLTFWQTTCSVQTGIQYFKPEKNNLCWNPKDHSSGWPSSKTRWTRRWDALCLGWTISKGLYQPCPHPAMKIHLDFLSRREKLKQNLYRPENMSLPVCNSDLSGEVLHHEFMTIVTLIFLPTF